MMDLFSSIVYGHKMDELLAHQLYACCLPFLIYVWLCGCLDSSFFRSKIPLPEWDNERGKVSTCGLDQSPVLDSTEFCALWSLNIPKRSKFWSNVKSLPVQHMAAPCSLSHSTSRGATTECMSVQSGQIQLLTSWSIKLEQQQWRAAHSI